MAGFEPLPLTCGQRLFSLWAPPWLRRPLASSQLERTPQPSRRERRPSISATLMLAAIRREPAGLPLQLPRLRLFRFRLSWQQASLRHRSSRLARRLTCRPRSYFRGRRELPAAERALWVQLGLASRCRCGGGCLPAAASAEGPPPSPSALRQ